SPGCPATEVGARHQGEGPNPTLLRTSLLRSIFLVVAGGPRSCSDLRSCAGARQAVPLRRSAPVARVRGRILRSFGHLCFAPSFLLSRGPAKLLGPPVLRRGPNILVSCSTHE